METLFVPEERGVASALLESECADNLSFCERLGMFARERIRFATLKLSAGSLAGLESEIDQAKRDWRDTLMDAGFGLNVSMHQRWFPDPRS